MLRASARACHRLRLPTPAAARYGTATKPPQLPTQARVVVCGGGIIGCSVAYHLAKLGWTDVLLLERDQITSGTTWHAAGLMVTFGSLSETSTELRKYSKRLYSTILEEETGLSTGFLPCGFFFGGGCGGGSRFRLCLCSLCFCLLQKLVCLRFARI